VDVSRWLAEHGLGHYADAFAKNGVAGDILRELTDADLKELGLNLGDRKRLLKAIAVLDAGPTQDPFLPAEAIATAAVPRDAERRQLTVLFCDLVGSTALAARLDPEDLRTVMRGYQAACADVIGHFDGHIAKFLGDGVLVYFGWPTAHEDDAERAVRAGLQLVETIARLQPHADVRLQARIGIATGPAVVGDLIGEGASREETVVGETPNLAARLQALAEPGAVAISLSTRRLVGGLFNLHEPGPQRLKGFAEPLPVWYVLGESQAEGRFEARQTAGLTPLVGREEEIALLLRRWRQARDGEGQVVLLSGEPGIGKSRLVRELRGRLESEPHVRLLYQCSPHHTTSPLHPLIEQLERAAACARDDPPEVKLDKLAALLAHGTDRLDQAVPLIAALLGLPTGGRYPPLDLTPQRQKQLTLAALVEQLEGLAAARAVLLAYEDVHWIDPTTQELLGLTIERIQRLPVLLLITFRPEFTPPWPSQPHVSVLALSRLGRRDGAALVDRVVGAKALPDEVAAQIVTKTDGVPLFVEELTKTVLESGLLRDAGNRYELSGPLPPLAIPSTLHDSLLARLDRLAPVKDIAQIGAVLGREFSHALLAAVADGPEMELQAALDQLVAAELVFRRGAPPDVTYSFKHALVQDAAYGTLLKSRRQHLHARIAKALEKQFPETVDSQPELLAHHCTQAGLIEKAVGYWYQAGRQGMARSAMVEAAAQLTQALDLLAGLPGGPDRDHKELDLQIALGAALIATRGWAAPEVERACARARELCAGEDQIPQLLAALYGLFLHHLHWSSKHVAVRIAGELLQLAEREQDFGAQVVGHRCLAVSLLYNGQLLPALSHFEQTLDLYDPAYHAAPVYWIGPDNRVAGLIFTALIFLFRGYPQQAIARCREALAAAQKLGHAFTTCQTLYLTCWFHQVLREPRVVDARASTLMKLATDHGLSAWAAHAAVLHGWAVGQGGAVEPGIAELRQGMATIEAMGVHQHTPGFLGLLAGLHLGTKNFGEALQALEEALARVDRLEERWFEPDLRRLKGDVLMALSPERSAEAEACYQQGLTVARDQSARLWELRAATSLARLWRDQGRRAEAHDLLAPVYGWFTEGFDIADLKDAKALLREVA
jgi:class 3 adenylate cyclase/predicted ATPase